MRRYAGEVLARDEGFSAPSCETKYGAAVHRYCMHRGDLQRGMHRKAVELGVRVCTSCRVTGVDFDGRPAVTLADGTSVVADLLVGVPTGCGVALS